MLRYISKSLFFCLFISHIYAAPLPKESFLFSAPSFSSCHASTLLELENGDILCAFFAGTEEGANDVGIWACRFSKGYWKKPVKIAQDPKEPCWNPVLTRLGDEILLFYKVGPNPERWSGVLKRSGDGGNTWSEEQPLPAGIFGPIKNKPLVFGNNILLCPSSTESYKRWGCFVEYTYDGGKSWNRSTPINLPYDYDGMIQPTLLTTGYQTLILLARTKNAGRIAKAISIDNGKTWSDAFLTTLPNPNSGIDAITLKDGRLLLVYNDSTEARTPLNVAISSDEGITWKNIYTLVEVPGEYSYPAVVQRSNGDILISYTWNRKNIRVVNLTYSELPSL